jgi:DNA-binding transcriptional ArsR family regulator
VEVADHPDRPARLGDGQHGVALRTRVRGLGDGGHRQGAAGAVRRGDGDRYLGGADGAGFQAIDAQRMRRGDARALDPDDHGAGLARAGGGRCRAGFPIHQRHPHDLQRAGGCPGEQGGWLSAGDEHGFIVARWPRAGRGARERGGLRPRAGGEIAKECGDPLVKRTVSSVVFRNMSFNTPDRRPDPGPSAGVAVPEPPAEGAMDTRKLTDARAMRALAHPVRLALLEALAHAGTLTATQASELLGESPANCAFHLRTLAKYGYVVEAGGGKGRERPWRRAHAALHIPTEQEDPGAALAAEELGQFWVDRLMERARSAISRRHAWPDEWRHTGLLGESEFILYLTPDEAREFGAEADRLYRRFQDRVDHPERRPHAAMPIEMLLFKYPLLHLAGWPVPAAGEGAPAPTEDPLE